MNKDDLIGAVVAGVMFLAGLFIVIVVAGAGLATAARVMRWILG